ncbi:hypothetical protein [Streptomyces hirsutus]|uniref:hypothetical protein n=1 Tax=Streptomyces hirsutus TaxID=35620 RepID=UPI003D9DC6AE
MRTPIWCRGQASQVGDACHQVIDQLLEVNALYRLRAAQGVLGLRKKYGDTRLEAACRKAAAVGDPSYRAVKGILPTGIELMRQSSYLKGLLEIHIATFRSVAAMCKRSPHR